MIEVNGQIVVTKAEFDRCIRVSSARRTDTGDEVTLEFLRWQWFKLCVRTAWRMLRHGWRIPEAWVCAASMLRAGVRV
jgi:hypothetical protein